MEFFTISLLNGLSYGLLLFMLSAGLTLIFSLLGVLNFAHASFYMLGAYFGHALAQSVGFWAALLLAPVALLASAVQTILASFARTFREAQTYLQFLMILPAVPSVMLMVSPLKPAVGVLLMPLLGVLLGC